MELTKLGVLSVCFLLFSACDGRQKDTTPPWGVASETDDGFDLSDIQDAGELIALTLSGPETYYEYRGRALGVQYLLAEQFARHLGVKLRVEVCKDTADMLRRLADDGGDLVIMRMNPDTLTSGWLVGGEKPELADSLQAWYRPGMLAEARDMERSLLAQPRVIRRVFAPMMAKGTISRYDGYFKVYGRQYGWDWRLLAALCYQESTFDPDARSWAGAQGLMQIMPGTADHLGLPRQMLNRPERNIEAGVRYLHELEGLLHDIHDRTERQNFAMASYNGGLQHIRDAMRLAERDGKNAQRWAVVREYVLRLSQPRYYQDPLVKSGYMRGQETADYVDMIRQRYNQYKRSAK